MIRTILAICCITLSVTTFAGGDEEMENFVNESRTAIKEFAGQLKGRLKSAMQEGGPVNAIQVCNIAAPEIAGGLSDKYNWKIGRTSLKLRNPDNAPDAWEQQVLEQFERRKREGADITKLDYYENTAEGFRYMKAIPTQTLCLTCHGETIAAPVQAKLNELYPQDKATGFNVGDLRGAFTVLRVVQ